MKFIIALHWNTSKTAVEKFRCVELNRQKELTEPAEKSREEVLEELLHGERFQILYQERCRWEFGPELEMVSTKKGSFIWAEEDPSESESLKLSTDRFPNLPQF